MVDFIKNALGFSKNPLGIIALFISLIYGFACLVLSSSLSNMIGNQERLPLIWFIVLFPVLILVSFIYLVVNHHEKLYAPGDYREDINFLEASGIRRIEEMQVEEVQKLVEAETIEQNISESIEANNSKEVESDKIETISQKYSNVETWVAKEISYKYNIDVKTNQMVNSTAGRFELDIVGSDANRFYVCEVKYWEVNKSNKVLKQSIQEFLRKQKRLHLIARTRDYKLIIALVFDSLKQINKEDYRKFIDEINDKVILEFYDYNELKNEYK